MVIGNTSTSELISQQNNQKCTILDVRPSAAFNGWALQGESRGGHIRGAISFPSSWVDHFSKAELHARLSSKGIDKEKKTIVYGYKDSAYSRMAELLLEFGFRNVSAYALGIRAWSADRTLPMDRLFRYEKLVYPDWVDALMSRDERGNPKREYRLFEVNCGGLQEYKIGHIPGAFHLNLESLESPPIWNLRSDDEILAYLLASGITASTLVVLYGRDTTAAARAASILMYAGVEDVRIIDGGFDVWIQAGFRVEEGVRNPIPASDFGGQFPAHPEYIQGMDEVKSMLAGGQGSLVSVRSWEEYIGTTSGYDFIEPKGRIAGALWGFSKTHPTKMSGYRNIDNTMLSYHEIESIWEEAHIAPNKKMLYYCGTGWRASEAFFFAHLMGRKNIAIYDGGWNEWCQNEANPFELGIPK